MQSDKVELRVFARNKYFSARNLFNEEYRIKCALSANDLFFIWESAGISNYNPFHQVILSVFSGYITLLRQVHAMLMQAAGKTPGLSSEPKPFVSQTALSDFYVEYRLSAQVERPGIRQITLTALHANIQDVFNEFGVQIMSPHYKNDPVEKVWVPREQWFEAPADEVLNGESA